MGNRSDTLAQGSGEEGAPETPQDTSSTPRDTSSTCKTPTTPPQDTSSTPRDTSSTPRDTSSTPRELKLPDGSSYTGESAVTLFGKVVPHGKGVAKGDGYTLTGTWSGGNFKGEKAEYEVGKGCKITFEREERTCLYISDVSLPGIRRMCGIFYDAAKNSRVVLWGGVKNTDTARNRYMFRGICILENSEVFAGLMCYDKGTYVPFKGVYVAGESEVHHPASEGMSTERKKAKKGSVIEWDKDVTYSYVQRYERPVGNIEVGASSDFFGVKIPEGKGIEFSCGPVVYREKSKTGSDLYRYKILGGYQR